MPIIPTKAKQYEKLIDDKLCFQLLSKYSRSQLADAYTEVKGVNPRTKKPFTTSALTGCAYRYILDNFDVDDEIEKVFISEFADLFDREATKEDYKAYLLSLCRTHYGVSKKKAKQYKDKVEKFLGS